MGQKYYYFFFTNMSSQTVILISKADQIKDNPPTRHKCIFFFLRKPVLMQWLPYSLGHGNLPVAIIQI